MSGAAIAIVCPPARTFPFTAAVTSKHELVSGCFVHADVEVCSIFCAVQSSAISVVAIFLFASKCPRSPMVTGVRALKFCVLCQSARCEDSGGAACERLRRIARRAPLGGSRRGRSARRSGAVAVCAALAA